MTKSFALSFLYLVSHLTRFYVFMDWAQKSRLAAAFA
jgi:hypothetical protein